MPFLLLDRIRELPLWFRRSCDSAFGEEADNSGHPRRAVFAYCLVFSGLAADITFVVGSICFLPEFSRDLDVFLIGCMLFVVGCGVYVVITSITFIESLHQKGLFCFEAFEHLLYLIGSWLYLVGSVLYWPSEAEYEHVEWMKGMAPGVYFNLMSPEFEGSILFILGSVLFVIAAFVNGLSIRGFDTYQQQLVTAITSMYMLGSLFFVMGSVAFLPELGCNETMMTYGCWAFIIGSILFVAGSCLNVMHTRYMLESKEHIPLLENQPMAQPIAI